MLKTIKIAIWKNNSARLKSYYNSQYYYYNNIVMNFSYLQKQNEKFNKWIANWIECIIDFAIMLNNNIIIMQKFNLLLKTREYQVKFYC